MAIKKKTVICTGTGSLTQSLDFGAAVGRVYKLNLLSNTDTTTSVTITDADGIIIATVASSDYTTLTPYYLQPVEASTFDTAGEVSAADTNTGTGVVCTSPLSCVAAGLDASETLTVDVFVEV